FSLHPGVVQASSLHLGVGNPGCRLEACTTMLHHTTAGCSAWLLALPLAHHGGSVRVSRGPLALHLPS
ncbi:MAG: hypothetical protein AB7K09_03680, partial [Planctomycetota bacterium]